MTLLADNHLFRPFKIYLPGKRFHADEADVAEWQVQSINMCMNPRLKIVVRNKFTIFYLYAKMLN